MKIMKELQKGSIRFRKYEEEPKYATNPPGAPPPPPRGPHNNNLPDDFVIDINKTNETITKSLTTNAFNTKKVSVKKDSLWTIDKLQDTKPR